MAAVTRWWCASINLGITAYASDDIRDELVGLFPRSTGTEPEVVLVAADLSQ
jgi:hypothetical protein